MAEGHEAFVNIMEQQSGFGNYATAGGLSIDIESESMNPGYEVRQNNNRMSRRRIPNPDSFQFGQQKPAGDLTFNPSITEMVPFLMNTFQDVGVNPASGTVKAGTFYGTLFFAMMETYVDWTGSTWGSIHNPSGLTIGGGTIKQGDVYPLYMIKYFGDEVAKSEVYQDMITDSLKFSVAVGGDLQFVQSFKAASFVDNSSIVPSELFIIENQFPDWQATVSIDSTDYDVESISLTIPNTTRDRMKLGRRSPARFPFGVSLPSGEFVYELQDNSKFPVFGSSVILFTVASGSDWMKIQMANAKFGNYGKNLTGAENPINNTIPFSCYPSGTSNGTPAIVCMVHGTFATRNFTCWGQ